LDLKAGSAHKAFQPRLKTLDAPGHRSNLENESIKALDALQIIARKKHAKSN
jgi:hypothetical protein